ncbi:HD domain-containing protein [Roseivirga sp.]|uniref:HD domain-containing protein n=1 Tax=Roseivirga sp. TaxID=1964215 RepID=UPI002B278F5B|nr:HD domain-containing protein [Roseivirga sp.]
MASRLDILRKAVFEKLQHDLDDVYTYHSVEHTQAMLAAVSGYTEHQDISDQEIELLKIAILFHDLGFAESAVDHEKRGAEMAKEAMNELGYSTQEMSMVEKLIKATKVPQKPESTLERIICDIDLDYLGLPEYEERSELLYKEWLALGIIKNRAEWEKRELAFLENHRFHSEFGLEQRQPVLEEHIKRIKAELKNKEFGNN